MEKKKKKKSKETNGIWWNNGVTTVAYTKLYLKIETKLVSLRRVNSAAGHKSKLLADDSYNIRFGPC